MIIMPHLASTINDEQSDFLNENGYVVLPSPFQTKFMDMLRHLIKQRLYACANELNCSYEDYLHSVSRWVDPSPVTQGLTYLIETLKTYLNPFLKNGKLVKCNVISKTPFSPNILPLHQDISYSPESPYQFSAWLALTDVPHDSGAMEVIPGSHTKLIEPAVDFWDPDYQHNTPIQNEKRIKLSVKMGDIVFFDSRLWHGSGENKVSYERFALVTRWRNEGWIPPVIPKIIPRPFGMWTCQAKTHKILKDSLHLLFNEALDDYENSVDRWIFYLKTQPFDFLKDSQSALTDLNYIRLLHLAHIKHNGGDAQGILYKRLWHSFLQPLTHHLKNNARRLNA